MGQLILHQKDVLTYSNYLMSIDAAIKEYVDSTVAKAVEDALARKVCEIKESQQTTDAPQIIRGINGLAKFLECSIPTAQKLKNKNKIPYRQCGRVLIFLADEVLNAMKKRQSK